jgi:hypothetical protein
MKPDELEERLAGAENVLALHGKQITSLEEREIKPPEIKFPHFDELEWLTSSAWISNISMYFAWPLL